MRKALGKFNALVILAAMLFVSAQAVKAETRDTMYVDVTGGVAATDEATASPSSEGESSETDADIKEVRDVVGLVNLASEQINRLWGETFAASGMRYEPPAAVVPYVTPMQTACGPAQSGNAFYCPASNAIYYDAVFLAQQRRTASAAVGADGSFAPVVIIAHEWGHAIQRQLGLGDGSSVGRELQADALAGAFAEWADRQGNARPLGHPDGTQRTRDRWRQSRRGLVQSGRARQADRPS